jgi:phosphatidylglycerol:prolipoprotein diacylglycerol transferase
MPGGIPSGFSIGTFYIRFYGIILMLGALAAAFLAEHEAKRKGLKSEFVWDALIWVLIAGIIGARLWHVFTPPPSMEALGYTTKYYLTHPLALINTRAGGLGIPGAVIGGGIGLYLYARHRKMSFLVWADIAAPGVALAQAIGRWGNYFNQELYGKPSNLPWAVHIDPVNRVPGYTQYSTFQPLFLYESIWNFLNMVLLLWMSRKYQDKLLDGDIFLTYLVVYPLGRFFLEFLRLDSPRFGTINVNQTVMLVVAVVSAFLIFWRHRTQGPTPQEIVQPGETPEDVSQPSEPGEN